MRSFKKWLFRRNWVLGLLAYALLSGPAIYMYYKAIQRYNKRER